MSGGLGRWPGADGALLVGLDALAVGLWWGKGLTGMGMPVALLVGLTALWLTVSAWARRPSSTQDWRGAWRGFPAGWQLLLTLLARGGRRPVQWALIPVVAVYWLFLRGPQRTGIEAYLARRMPDATRAARSRAHFWLLLNFAHSLVDRFHLLLHGYDRLSIDHSLVPGLKDEVYGEQSAGHGLLVLSGHLGNPDFASTALNSAYREVTIVLHKNPTDPYFQLLAGMGQAAPRILAVNESAGMASVEIGRRLNAGGVVAMKADRAVDGRTARVRFLGGEIDLPTGPLLIAALSGAPVLILGCFRIGDLQYRMEAVGPRRFTFQSRATRNEDLQRWAQELATIFEGWTERYPLQWYNFFDPWNPAPVRDSPPVPSIDPQRPS
jgi:predicted LPLAT superfamily acyltransferase